MCIIFVTVMTPIEYACNNNYLNLAKVLVRHGIKLDFNLELGLSKTFQVSHQLFIYVLHQCQLFVYFFIEQLRQFMSTSNVFDSRSATAGEIASI